jgi:hypothetical protein
LSQSSRIFHFEEETKLNPIYMVVKIQVLKAADSRWAKEIAITTKDRTIIYEGKASKDILKALDGARYAYFLALSSSAKESVTLDARLHNLGW